MSISTERNNTIDFLRGLGIFMVFFVHYGQLFGNPLITAFCQLGCQIFFFASGYICSFSLSKSKTIIEFYKKRIISIIPSFYSMIIIVAILNMYFLNKYGQFLICSNPKPILNILCNFFLIHGISPSFQNTGIPGGWFIGTLFICYILHPILDLLYKKIKLYWLPTVLISLFMLSITVLLSIKREGTIINNSFEYFLFTNQISCYLIGITLYYFKKINRIPKKSISLILALVFFAISFVLFKLGFPFCHVIYPTTFALFASFLFQFLSHYSLNGKLINLICKAGKYSMSIYLTHWIVVYEINPIFLKPFFFKLGFGTNFALFLAVLIPAIICELIIAYVFHQITEKLIKEKVLNNLFKTKG